MFYVCYICFTYCRPLCFINSIFFNIAYYTYTFCILKYDFMRECKTASVRLLCLTINIYRYDPLVKYVVLISRRDKISKTNLH